MTRTILYGIPNCDTVKKARAWLVAQGVAHDFHDFKKAGVSAEQLDRWMAVLPWDAVLNRKGSTWRQLDVATQAGVMDVASARAVMQAHPSAIKRPVVEWASGRVTVGFDAAQWATLA